MEQLVTSDFKLGIIAGGQLGKMLALAASRWDVKTYILDSDDHCPASTVCTRFVEGDYRDFEKVYEFGQQVDMVTFEIENVNVEALRKLKQEGKRIYPDPEVLAMIQDKGVQKQFYLEHGIPSPAFVLCDGREQVIKSIGEGVQFPFVQKARKAGYDGKGVVVVRGEGDLGKLLDVPCVVERAVDIDKELAVIVTRNGRGEMACFSAVEMVFNPEANLVELLVSPAEIDADVQDRAIELARQVTEKSGIQGVLAVELFLDTDGELWVNEAAPRPHNSGHHTIESAITSQYEQHLRAIFNFPLGSTDLKRPAVMMNLLGDREHEGPVRYEGLTESMAIPGVKVHIYGKKETRPFRKMGHVTIVSPTTDEAKKHAVRVRDLLKVKS
ncbi:N5-carboxyaminoimidazole ribonucleotide synthase [Anaerohalosphaera lusitana]|uniref:N5-carboxyaminoimidazole ribonucleotide synthase n=1 Tax=Anaerohalosphaera lusitana TaxID=1936003 RepID=A0A1U9NP34_9BACT|nr:5-(carboxyamino)imidazole ribonucleotide synthase [Anaerohalosphaera lusitana]AQT69673.1 N5-carboxyaminoimidazole ribonucleotide synthase [Anaerohalosphaera lusitana]